MTIDNVALPTISYFDVTDPGEMHRRLREAREQAAVVVGPYGLEVLTYEHVRTVLRDDRFVMPKGVSLAAQGITSGPVWDFVGKILLSLDGEEHQRQRRLVSKAFTAKAAERLRPTCVSIITDLVERHGPTGQCDVVADIARPYPVPIICALLGVPRKDWQQLSAWADEFFKIVEWNVVNDTPAIMRAWDALQGYVDALATARRESLSDDLLSDLIYAEVDGDRLAHDELLVLVATLLMAGTDTARNQLAAGVQVLLDHPDQWALLAERPDLIPRAVDEIMRFYPVILNTLRVATTDVELAGVGIAAGTLVIANTASANRDPQVYGPDRFDITRESAPAMLTFGGGVHFCLGAHLARIELAEALSVITQRMRAPRALGPAPWRPMVGITGPATLSIAFQFR